MANRARKIGVAVLILVFLWATNANAQTHRILPYTVVSPVAMTVHGSDHIVRFANGQIALVDTASGYEAIPTPSGDYIENVVSSESQLWMRTSAGFVRCSFDSGRTWISALDRYQTLNNSSDGRIIASTPDRIVRLRSVGYEILAETIHIKETFGLLRDVVVDGDTIACIDSTGALHCILQSAVITTQVLADDDFRELMFDNKGKIYARTESARLYVEDISLKNPFRSAIEDATNYSVLSIVQPPSGERNADLIITAQQRSGNGLLSVLIVVDGASSRLIRVPDSLSDFTLGSLVNSKLLVARAEGGLFIGSSNSWRMLSGSSMQLLRRTNHSPYIHNGNVQVLRYSFKTINKPSNLVIYGNETRILEVDSWKEPIVDSVGVITYAAAGSSTSQMFAGSMGLAYTASSISPWAKLLTGDVRCLQELSDSLFIASVGGNRIALSLNGGLDWSTRILKGVFGGFYRARLLADYVALDGGLGTFVVPLFTTDDTVTPVRLVDDSWAIKTSGDTIISVGFTNDAPPSTTQTITFRKQLGTSIIASNGITISQPVKLQGSQLMQYRDGVLLYDRLTSRLLFLKDRSIALDTMLPWYKRQPFQSNTSTSVALSGERKLIRCLPDLGVWDEIDVAEILGATSVVDQNIFHFYLDHVRPNPSSTQINVDVGKFVTADRSLVTLQLCAMDGQVVRDFTSQLPPFGSGNEKHPLTLDISNVASGPYLLVVRNSQNAHSFKVVIVK